MERIMAVYDVEPHYADRLADVANQKEKVPFTVVAFTAIEHLKEYEKNHRIEILLISSSVPEEVIKEIGAEQVIRLTDGEAVLVKDSSPSIYKYQSANHIIREIMSYYCEQPTKATLVLMGAKAKIMGVYSPIGRCLKTSFAWTLGQQMGKDRKVLFISLQEYSGFSRMVPGDCQSDLSDVFYILRQGAYNIFKLSSMIYTWGNLDYIPPVRYPEDLTQITGEEVCELLEKIAVESSYEVIVVDMGHMGKAAVPMMEVCDVVYMPVKEDCISVAKLEEFDEYLEVSGKSALQDKIKRLKLPYHNSFGRRDTYLEQLLWGELGDYVRKLLKRI